MTCSSDNAQQSVAKFTLRGQYRVQSRRISSPSLLDGEWFSESRLIIDDEVNRVLEEHPYWSGQTRVALKPALVHRREGKFSSEPDVLYKRDLFFPEAGSSPMPSDIVDIVKSQQNWHRRESHAKTLFGESVYHDAMQRHLAPLEVVIANEYVLHEAGHLFAYDIDTKHGDGYFTLNGQTVWNLVYLEEFRADLNAFGIASQYFAPEQAAQVLMFNLLQRLAVHRQGLVRDHLAPYGLVPYLLFCLLREIGLISLKRSDSQVQLQLASFTNTDLTQVMRMCALHGEKEFNVPEMTRRRPLDCAMTAASYVRSRLMREEVVDEFAILMQQPLSKDERAEIDC